MRTTRITVHFGKGKFYYLIAPPDDPNSIVVPYDLILMWNAAADNFSVMQEQLRRIADEIDDART